MQGGAVVRHKVHDAGALLPGAPAGASIRVLVPGNRSIGIINTTIFDELGKGIFLPETKKIYLDIIREFISLGAQGIILGCTEIPLLLKQEDCQVPLFDTTRLHAVAAVDFAYC